MGDGFPSDEDIPATYSANRVVGDIYPQGADDPFQRLTNTRGGGLLTTNSDPNVVGTDPLTGASAPVGTDVGFSAPMRRFVHTGVLNGDFSQPPPSTDEPISDSNVLPYWTWTPPSDGSFTLTLVADAAAASGYALQFNGSTASGQDCYIQQLIPVPMSQGQQYRVLASFYAEDADYWYQFIKADGVTTIGSAVFAAGSGVAGERKIDVGLVPTNAAYLRLRVGRVAGSSVTRKVYEVRCAFLPAEATIGLGSLSAAVTGITTTETVGKEILIPAGTLVVGSVYEFVAYGTLTTGGAGVLCTFRFRIGTTTLGGTAIISSQPTANAGMTNAEFEYRGLVTVRSVGATGTVVGGLTMAGSNTGPFGSQAKVDHGTGTTTVDTTAANYLGFTAQTAAGTCTIAIRQAVWKCVMAS